MSGTTSNYLLGIPQSIDYGNPTAPTGIVTVETAATADTPATTTYVEITADTRFRLGYPLLTKIGETVTDAVFARDVLEDIPAGGKPAYDTDGKPLVPALADERADVRRALSYKPATGISFVTGARFNAYLKGNFDTRVADGSVLFYAVDQEFEAAKPGLSYLRLGKPEPELQGAAGAKLARKDDELMDQKYKPGIGMFSDGGFNAWVKQPINMRSDEAINLIAPGYCLSTYGESLIVSYEIDNHEDIKRINAGDLTDQEVNRRIVNINMLRSTDLGWYRQIFDRGRSLSYTTSNKGDFSIGASYSLGVGAKFEHSVSAGLATSFTGQVLVSKGFSIDFGTSTTIFKHPFGSFTQEDNAEISANRSINLAVSGIDTVPIQANVKGLSLLMHAAVAAQTLAFTAYNAVLAGQADRTLTAADSKDRGDDTYGLKTALDDGMRVYEAALSLSAITCAAGIILGAKQAYWTALRKADPLTANIELSRDGIFLRYGGNGIEIGPRGVRIIGLVGGVSIGGTTITNMSPSVNNTAVPPVPIRPRMPV